MSYADAVAREAAWLATSGDGLPALLKAAGGRWDVVQGYWPGNRLHAQRTGIYVLRSVIEDHHPLAMRYRPQYVFTLKLVWPIRAAASIAETEQQNLDNAIDDLIVRVNGPVGDKTHGGRFLSVAEVPETGAVRVDFTDPEQTIQAEKALRAQVTYYADDIEFTG